MRCTKSVSIPAPVHYASLAAYQSRALKFGDDHDNEKYEFILKKFIRMMNLFDYIFSIDEDDEDPENYTMEDIKTKLMVLDEKVADDMWFI